MDVKKSKSPYNRYIERMGLIGIILFGLISLLYERFFPLVFVVAGLTFLLRIIEDIREKNYKMMYGNLIIMSMFIIGVFLTI